MCFLGLTVYVGFSWQSQFMFFIFIGTTLSWVLVLGLILIQFWFLQVHIIISK